jgi:hypothetical protein
MGRFANRLRPADDLPLPVTVFGKGGTASYPVTAVAVKGAIDVSHLSAVNVATQAIEMPVYPKSVVSQRRDTTGIPYTFN